jgi:arginase
MHGMPVAFLCGEDGFDGILPDDRATLNPENVIMLGIRDVDAGERVIAQKSGLKIHDMREIDERHIVHIVDDIIAMVKAQNGVLHVSFDADSLDPSIAPGVGTPVEGGLSYREAHLALEKIHEAGILWSCDFVELNPYIDHNAKTTKIMIGMIESLFGRRVLD